MRLKIASALTISAAALAACDAISPSGEREPDLVFFFEGYRDDADQCRQLAETAFTAPLLSDNADLVGCPEDFGAASLEDASLEDASLEGSGLEDTGVGAAVLEEAGLEGANPDDTDLAVDDALPADSFISDTGATEVARKDGFVIYSVPRSAPDQDGA